MDLDVRDRVFDGFLTTKAAGAGTGLGLANSRRFAEGMGGDVDLEEAVSELGEAGLRLVLPIQERSSERISKAAPREAEVRESNAIG
jgi:signal transduction histidine kinase